MSDEDAKPYEVRLQDTYIELWAASMIDSTRLTPAQARGLAVDLLRAGEALEMWLTQLRPRP